MTTHEEGYIKFLCHWQQGPPTIPVHLFREVNNARGSLWERGWIGCYDNGIGFGNISLRDSGNRAHFYITGSATGQIEEATPAEYAKVERWDIAANELWCTGPLKASSESMSHAIIYQTMPEVMSVVHIHNIGLWQRGITILPSTPAEVAYGTPEMAHAIRELILRHNMTTKGLLAMKGHEEGIIAFGDTVLNALETLYAFAG